MDVVNNVRECLKTWSKGGDVEWSVRILCVFVLVLNTYLQSQNPHRTTLQSHRPGLPRRAYDCIPHSSMCNFVDMDSQQPFDTLCFCGICDLRSNKLTFDFFKTAF